MADSEDTTQGTPGGEPNRDSVAGRYKPQHDDSDKDGDGKPKDKDDDGKKRWLLLLLLLLILLLLLCAGFAYMKWWKKDPVPAGSSPSPSVVVTTEAPKSPTPSPSPSASPSPTVKTVAMPNVVDKPAAEAKTILEAAGFTNIKFVAVDKPTEGLTLLVSFVVTAQSVPAGTQVPVDTALVITCKSSSNGKG